MSPKVPDEATPEEAHRIVETNWVYEALPPEAKERFLEVLAAARERGLPDVEAWREAVRAAERTYPPELQDEDLGGGPI